MYGVYDTFYKCKLNTSQTRNKLRITLKFLNVIRLGLSICCYYNELLLTSTHLLKPLLLLLQAKYFLFLRMKFVIFNKLVVANYIPFHLELNKYTYLISYYNYKKHNFTIIR